MRTMSASGEFVLASTFEKVGVPDDLVARIEGKPLGDLIDAKLGAYVRGGLSTRDRTAVDAHLEDLVETAADEVMLLERPREDVPPQPRQPSVREARMGQRAQCLDRRVVREG